MSEEEARSLLIKVLAEKWSTEHRAILGSQLKAALIDAASRANSEFNETELGFRNFADFLTKTGVVAVRFREGTDILVAPLEHKSILDDEPESRMRIRKDFWDAFIGFPSLGELRGYNPTTDRIQVVHSDTLPEGFIAIEAAPKELQLSWRRDFIDSLDPNSPLRAVRERLADYGGFTAFAQALRDLPELRPAWNRAWVAAALTYIGEWARRSGIKGTPWMVGSQPEERSTSTAPTRDSDRRRLYSVLDQIPLDRLARVKIPLGWFIGRGGDDD